MKKKIKVALKIVISIALIYLVLRNIDTSKLFETIKKSNIWWLLVAFIFFNLSKIVSAIRLNWYFKDCGVNLSTKTNLILYYIGMFYNLFLPGGIGGDGYKIYLLKKRFNTKVSKLLQATLLDRLSGLIALLFLAALLFIFSKYGTLYPLLKWLAVAVAIVIYPIFIYMHKRLFKGFLTYLKQTTLYGLLVQILQLITAIFIILALKDSVPIVEFLFLFLFSSVVAVLPLTIGGVGAREFTFLYGLKLLSLEPTSGVAFSFIFFLITFISSAIGALFLHKEIF